MTASRIGSYRSLNREMSITDIDYAFESVAGQRANITGYFVGAIYGNGTAIPPLLATCINDPTCFAVTQTSGEIITEHGTGITGWTSQPGSTTNALKFPRSVLCNSASIPEPYNTYCLTNYCMQAPNFGQCDLLFGPYCKATPTDPKCACINSPTVTYSQNPLCQDRACIDTGYATASMMNSKSTGCSIISCTVAETLINNGGVQLADPTIDQRCGATATTTATASSTGGFLSFTGMNTTTMVILGVIALIVIAAIYFLFFR